MSKRIAFIGGGNMASALISGLIKQGLPTELIDVVEPFSEARDKLQVSFGITAHPETGAFLMDAALVVWAVKPQTFKAAALAVAPHVLGSLHLSVAAGIRSDSVAVWLGTERVVRAMPNTPALIGQGITGLFARASVTANDKAFVEQVIATTGASLWLDDEDQLDVVTALSGSGPAYVFYFMEAMAMAGTEMGLSREQALQLAIATFSGASALAKTSGESPQVLRQRVTSKGGTTFAAISSMEDNDVRALFIDAMYAARERAKELGDEFGAN
ncbi:pyrroline-5-carboxylate reductase [Rhodoferax sp.]|uniref:pyrroline-5-carboxylate reductase n=1 Tax=Rhodoferax sp. TaxID=50421 RepID=UPI0008C6838F|nr:pyrroline-5-carboxylate reductase [Rhodoferax sp.]MDO8320364.1 pyrroline-5-carboxylate reductase [Rhodoferax sp.]MDP2677415.1 pyrroline-5-carboxylate reductase [Rhodoferax sp.]OGB80312.1 MAG: pyrroline-5-carboxylate reductase [Burkholderiales bacterium RIFOXYC12_FULL_60_6]